MTEPTLVTNCAISFIAKSKRSAQTRLGIAHAKQRGVIWGSAGKSSAAKNQVTALLFAESLRPLLIELGVVGPLSPTRLARELNRHKIKTPSGGKWYAVTVGRVLARLGPSLIEDVATARSANPGKPWTEASAIWNAQHDLSNK
jgi:hypothetical protein